MYRVRRRSFSISSNKYHELTIWDGQSYSTVCLTHPTCSSVCWSTILVDDGRGGAALFFLLSLLDINLCGSISLINIFSPYLLPVAFGGHTSSMVPHRNDLFCVLQTNQNIQMNNKTMFYDLCVTCLFVLIPGYWLKLVFF